MSYIQKVLVLSLVALGYTVIYAFGQDDTAVSRQSFLYDVWTVVQPIVTTAVTVVGPIVVTWLAYQLSRVLNITDINQQKELEKKIRDALHQAAANALKYAISKQVGPLPDLIDGKVPTGILKDAVDYVKTMNPDTVKEAKLDTTGLEDIILSKVPDVLATISMARELDPTKPPAPRKK